MQLVREMGKRKTLRLPNKHLPWLDEDQTLPLWLWQGDIMLQGGSCHPSPPNHFCSSTGSPHPAPPQTPDSSHTNGGKGSATPKFSPGSGENTVGCAAGPRTGPSSTSAPHSHVQSTAVLCCCSPTLGHCHFLQISSWVCWNHQPAPNQIIIKQSLCGCWTSSSSLASQAACCPPASVKDPRSGAQSTTQKQRHPACGKLLWGTPTHQI